MTSDVFMTAGSYVWRICGSCGLTTAMGAELA